MPQDEEVSVPEEGQEKGDDGLNEVLIEGFDDEFQEEKAEEVKDEPKEKEPVKEEESETEKRLKSIEQEVSKLRQDKTNLQKALHEERQSKKGKETGSEEKLTDAQLTKLLEEYKDDPQTLKNIVRYIAKEEARGVKTEVLNETDIASKKKEVDTFLKEDLPDLGRDDSELKNVVNDIKRHFGLEEHPFGDLFAVGAHMVMNRKALLQSAFDAGKKAALGDKGETARREVIKGKELLKGGKKVGSPGELSAGHREVANILGISKRRPGESDASYNQRMKIFKSVVNKPGAAVTVEG